MKTKLKLQQISVSAGNNALPKVLMVIMVLFLGFMQIQAQDIIVRNSGDTVFCKITGTDDSKIFFDYAKKDGKIISTFVTRDEVKEFRYNVLPSAPAAANKQESTQYSQARTIYSIGGGFAKTMGSGSEYFNMGFSIAGDIFKRMNNNVLIGGRLAYNYFTINTDKILSDLEDAGLDVSGIDASGSSSIIEIVPCIRFESSAPTSKIFGQVGFGYYMLKSEYTVSSDVTSESGNSSDEKFGLHIAVGFCLTQSSNYILYIYPAYSRISTEGTATEYWTANLCFTFGK